MLQYAFRLFLFASWPINLLARKLEIIDKLMAMSQHLRFASHSNSVLLTGIYHNLPLQLHCTILLWTVFIQSMKHAFLLRLSLSKKIQKPNLGLSQGSKTPVVGNILFINNLIL